METIKNRILMKRFDWEAETGKTAKKVKMLPSMFADLLYECERDSCQLYSGALVSLKKFAGMEVVIDNKFSFS